VYDDVAEFITKSVHSVLGRVRVLYLILHFGCLKVLTI